MDRDELFAVDLVLLHPKLGIVPALIMLGLAVLLGFYFWHYFFLENTVQRWYRIAEELQEKRSEYSGTFCKPDTIEACKI